MGNVRRFWGKTTIFQATNGGSNGPRLTPLPGCARLPKAHGLTRDSFHLFPVESQVAKIIGKTIGKWGFHGIYI